VIILIYYKEIPIKISLAFLIGGSLGNGYDHVFNKKVTDFIKIKNLYINFADIFIFIGLIFFAIIMLIDII